MIEENEEAERKENIEKYYDALNDINAKYEKGKGYINNTNNTDFHKFLGKK